MTTRQQWAQEWLTFSGFPVTAESVIAVVAWAAKEGSDAEWNPLDTTEPAEGATDYNHVGVKNYPSQQVGNEATLTTIRNGYYPHLVRLLETDGTSALAIASSPDLNVWGTGNFTAEVESIKGGDPHGYMTHVVAGSGVAPSPPAPPGPAPAPQPAPGGTVMVELPLLRNGSAGQAVTSAQLLLNARNASLAVDGHFGPATEQAVREFQSVLHLTVDGVVGSQTWAALVAV